MQVVVVNAADDRSGHERQHADEEQAHADGSAPFGIQQGLQRSGHREQDQALNDQDLKARVMARKPVRFEQASGEEVPADPAAE